MLKLLKPTRRLFLAGGVGLIAAPAIVRAGSLSLLGAGKPPAGGAPASSVWGDHGTNVSLSTTAIANDTATGLASSNSSVRGTQARTSGKFYFEVKVLSAPGTALFTIGMMDDTTASGAAMDASLLANSAGHTMFNGTDQSNGWTGVNLGAAFSLANNDILGVAADFTNQFYYLSKNNTYFLSGDPTSGATGTGAVGNGARTNARPMLTVWGASNGVYQLITGAGSILNLPTGYTAWG